MSVSTAASLPYAEPQDAPQPGLLRPVRWAVDRHVEGRMGFLGRLFWALVSPTYRSSALLWDEVVEVEVRLLARQAARLEAELEVSRLVREDTLSARRFWGVVRSAW